MAGIKVRFDLNIKVTIDYLDQNRDVVDQILEVMPSLKKKINQLHWVEISGATISAEVMEKENYTILTWEET